MHLPCANCSPRLLQRSFVSRSTSSIRRSRSIWLKSCSNLLDVEKQLTKRCNALFTLPTRRTFRSGPHRTAGCATSCVFARRVKNGSEKIVNPRHPQLKTMITIKSFDGNKFDAYLALPTSGYGPGIVVLQEIFGVNNYMRSVADWYAAHGFVGICPDLFWRIEPGVQLTDKGDDW